MKLKLGKIQLTDPTLNTTSLSPTKTQPNLAKMHLIEVKTKLSPTKTHSN